MDIFWIKKPSIIFEDYYKIIPTPNMSRIEQMNTISRLILYYMLLIIIFNRNSTIILYCIIALIMICVIYFIYSTNEKGVIKDLINENENEYSEFKNIENCPTGECRGDYDPAIDSVYDDYNDIIYKGDTKIALESGYIDSNGDYNLGKDNSIINLKKYNKNKKEKDKKTSYDKNELYKKNTCKEATVENPFNNIVFSDYLDMENLPVACNSSDENIQTNEQNLYNSSIFRNTSDVFSRENSQRLFYTPPISILPESQENFANWCFKQGKTCKENTNNCTYYEEPYMTSQRY
jgi:hypothetical protein